MKQSSCLPMRSPQSIFFCPCSKNEPDNGQKRFKLTPLIFVGMHSSAPKIGFSSFDPKIRRPRRGVFRKLTMWLSSGSAVKSYVHHWDFFPTLENNLLKSRINFAHMVTWVTCQPWVSFIHFFHCHIFNVFPVSHVPHLQSVPVI